MKDFSKLGELSL